MGNWLIYKSEDTKSNKQRNKIFIVYNNFIALNVNAIIKNKITSNNIMFYIQIFGTE